MVVKEFTCRRYEHQLKSTEDTSATLKMFIMKSISKAASFHFHYIPFSYDI